MIIQWIRRMLSLGEHSHTTFEVEHFKAFEQAVEEGDVVAYVYDERDKGPVVVHKGSPFHAVNASNLVSFYKLNRETRRRMGNVKIVVGDQAFKQA